uniref:Protein BUD31 homolog n=6 Tax=Clupeocephala TaxID=186625 RepID=A0A8P4K2B3_DICLA
MDPPQSDVELQRLRRVRQSKKKTPCELFVVFVFVQNNMPKVKRSRKPPPDGWELIEPTLDELDQKMREAETEPHEGKRKVESLWPIFRLHHQRSRYIFDLFYKRKAISRELYDYCIKEGYADKNLIAKWKKQGYENLCCLRCIQTRDTNFGTNCICRVPKSKLEVGRIIECTHCGCRGCSG